MQQFWLGGTAVGLLQFRLITAVLLQPLHHSSDSLNTLLTSPCSTAVHRALKQQKRRIDSLYWGLQ